MAKYVPKIKKKTQQHHFKNELWIIRTKSLYIVCIVIFYRKHCLNLHHVLQMWKKHMNGCLGKMPIITIKYILCCTVSSFVYYTSQVTTVTYLIVEELKATFFAIDFMRNFFSLVQHAIRNQNNHMHFEANGCYFFK